MIKLFKRFPVGMGHILFIQIFSSIAYGVLASTVWLYLQYKHFGAGYSSSLTAVFLAFNFVLHLLGGYFGGRFASFRSLFLVSLLMQGIGCMLLAVPDPHFLYYGLALFLTGAGINVPCINCILMGLFKPADKLREAAFLWNLAFVNIGFLLSDLLAGHYQLTHHYDALFLIAGLLNLICIVSVIVIWRRVADDQTRFSQLTNAQKNQRRFGVFVLLTALYWVLLKSVTHPNNSNILILCFGVGVLFAILMKVFFTHDAQLKRKIQAYLLLTTCYFICMILVHLMGTGGITSLVIHHVNLNWHGMTVPPQWLDSIETYLLIIGPIVFSLYVHRFNHCYQSNSIPLRFSLGLFFIGLTYLILYFAVTIHFQANSEQNNLIPIGMIALAYFLFSIAEIFILPIAYAMIGELFSMKDRGLFFGALLMFGGTAAPVSGYLSKWVEHHALQTNPLPINNPYAHLFLSLLIVTVVMGGIFMSFRKKLAQWIVL